MSDAFIHEDGCDHVGPHSDAAKRAADAVNMHLAVLGLAAFRRWVAIRLQDGGSDHVLYDERIDAVEHQLHEQLCAYVRIPPTGLKVCGAEAFLTFHRKAYAGGMRLVDPEHKQGGRQVIPRLTNQDQARQLHALGRR